MTLAIYLLSGASSEAVKEKQLANWSSGDEGQTTGEPQLYDSPSSLRAKLPVASTRAADTGSAC